MHARRFFNLGMVLIFMLSFAGTPAQVLAQGSVPNPIIWGVNASSNWISGMNWPANTSVQISIDNPSTFPNPDFATTQNTDSSGNLNYQSSYDILIGSVISVTDGTTTKQVTVSNFEVRGFDANTHTLSGIGTPYANAGIWIIDPGGWTSFAIGDSGYWQADLSEVADIRPWSRGFAIEQDSDGDGTQSNWPSRYIEASIDGPGHSIEGYEWPLGSSVTLTVDNPGNDTETDYTDVQIVELDTWNRVQVQFDLGDFKLKTGAAVTLRDRTTSRTHAVTYLDLTNVDTSTDRIFGKADPGSTVQVEAPNHARRSAVADQSGNWVVDFSTPGPGNDEQGLDDIQEGTGFTTRQYDDQGNSTRLYWVVPAYRVIAYPDEDVIAATDFWPGTPVTITIDDPGTGAGVDLTRTGFVDTETGGWECQTWWGFCFVLDLHDEFDIQAGQLITITDGTHTVSHVVTTLQITYVDWTASTVYGTAPAGSEISLDLWPSCGQRRVFADEHGSWLEDFSISGDEAFEQQTCDFSADPLRDIVAYQRSGEGETWVGSYASPKIEARYHENEVYGYDWPLGTPVTITIYDPDTPEPVDYVETETAIISDQNVNQTIVEFRLWENNFELENGQTVTMSDGTTTKTHVVAVPRITGIVSQSGISQVEGLAAPSAEIWVDFKGATRHETADGTGHWLADFHVSGDEDFETQTTGIDAWNEGEARVQDEDGDLTSTNWGRGLLMLELESDGSPQQNVYIRHWPGRQPVTLLIDNPATPQSPDYTDIRPMRRWSDGSSRLTIDWTGVFDVHPGFTITVTDGYVAKSVTVPLLVITGYDLANDTISGRSAPLTTVVVPISNSDGSAEYAERSVLADINGNWLANFAVSNNPDEVIYDVRPGDGVEAQIYDEDSDHTVLRDWSIPIEWTLKGFYQPVDMNGVYNTVKNGSTVPFKFEVFAGSIELMDTADIESFTYIQIACDTSASTDNIETTVTGGNSLRYDPVAGQFIYNWKTPKTAGACYRVTMTTTDSSSLLAYFKLK